MKPGLARLAAPGAALAITVLLWRLPASPAQGYDWVHMQVFFKEYYRQALLSGQLPLWEPFVGLGRPFLADVETATLYPPNLVYLLGPGAGLILSVALHLWLALEGMLRLARRLGCRKLAAWFAATAFVIGAPLLGRLQGGQAQVFCALCWMPAVFLAARAVLDEPGRKNAATLAAASALMFLAGSPWVCWITGWGLALWVAALLAGRRSWPALRLGAGWLACAAALAGALAAVQFLPFLELVQNGNRSDLPADFALQNPLQPASSLSLLESRPEMKFFYWEFNLYSGILLVPLALLALRFWRQRDVRPLVVVGLAFLLLALGPSVAALPWLVAHVPGWDSFRYPSRYAVVLVLALDLLGALALEGALRRAENFPRAARGCALALIVITTLDGTRALVERTDAYASPPLDLREAEIAGALRAKNLLAPGRPPPRVLAPPWLVREDSGLQFGYCTVSTFANPVLGRVWNSLHAAIGAIPDTFDRVNLPVLAYSVAPERFAGFDLAARWNPPRNEFEFPPSSRRAWIGQAQSSSDRIGLNGGKGGTAGGIRSVDLPEPAADGGDGDHCEVSLFAPEHIVVFVHAAKPATLALAEPWYPGWAAQIDGRPEKVELANGWMRAVSVPAGVHTVDFAYHSRWLALGAALTLGAIGIAGTMRFRQ